MCVSDVDVKVMAKVHTHTKTVTLASVAAAVMAATRFILCSLLPPITHTHTHTGRATSDVGACIHMRQCVLHTHMYQSGLVIDKIPQFFNPGASGTSVAAVERV